MKDRKTRGNRVREKGLGLFHEFRTFIGRGNVVELAVGVIIGSAFTAIVNSLANHVIMPVISYFINGLNFSDYKFVLRPAEGGLAEVAVLYGDFLQQVVNFIIIALVVFFMMKLFNRLQRKKEAAPKKPAEPSAEVKLLTEIRDLLKEQNTDGGIPPADSLGDR